MVEYHPPLSGALNVSSGFGQRDGKLHDGVDYAAPAGTTIYSVLPGKVVTASFSSGWGNQVVIDHGVIDGERIQTRYAHMQSLPSVTVGQTVTGGQTIGKVGSTGDSTGPHLHFALYEGAATNNGTAVNPGSILDKATDVIGGIIGGILGLNPATAAAGALLESALGSIAESLRSIATTFTSIGKVADGLMKLSLPTMGARISAGVFGLICLVLGIVFIAREV